MMYTAIISCSQGSFENLYADLVALGFVPLSCCGTYNNEGDEPGYMVTGTASSMDFVMELARDYDQDAILVIERDTRKAWILNNDMSVSYAVGGGVDHHGLWCRVKESDVSGDYTYIQSTNTYCQIK